LLLEREPLATRKSIPCFWRENYLLRERTSFASGERTTCYQIKTTCSETEPHAACSKRLLGLIKKAETGSHEKYTGRGTFLYTSGKEVLCTSERQSFCYLIVGKIYWGDALHM
jgi:hypothetical protein